MKFLIVTIAFLACAFADVSELSSGYNYHHPEPQPHYHSQPQQSYLPPEVHHEVISEPIHVPAPSYLPSEHHEHHHEHHEHYEHHEAPVPVQEYIPPPPPVHHEEYSQPINNYVPPVQHHEHHEHYEHHEQPVHFESHEPAHEDGYRYKTVRRVVYRHRQ